ncbi:MAG: preprotein translocase subunit SecY [Clostridiales bacterium]|nr:preprotein translocase subunit SecY [Clostridiales bacterium]
MIETIRNAWRIPDLRKKILFTFVILVIFRIGSAIPVPFINRELLSQILKAYEDTILGFFDTMSGGGFSQANIFALSVQPYINASIIMQLLSVAIPSLERMVKEGGEAGRKKLASITRYATIALGLLQGYAYYTLLARGGGDGQSAISTGGINSSFAAIIIILTFCAGSTFIMWLGEQITDNGIGNGISIILFASIVSRGPAMISLAWGNLQSGAINWFTLALLVVVFIAVIAFIVFITDSERRLPVQYAKKVVGRKIYGGRSTHLPLKVNMSGVMPIIFASSIATFPMTVAAFFRQPQAGTFWHFMQKNVFSPTSSFYAVMYFLLIIMFSYFYAAIQYNPIEIANNLKNNGGFIPGFRPGRPTSDFITKVMNKITLFGAIFLGIIAVLPIIVGSFSNISGLAIGGTSILIVVGVALETVKQLEAQMIMRNYKGFLE